MNYIIFALTSLIFLEPLMAVNHVKFLKKELQLLREKTPLFGISAILFLYFSIKYLAVHKTLLVVFAILLFLFPVPLIDAWNLILEAITCNKSIYIDTNVYFPGASLFESNFNQLRRETLDIIEKSNLMCIDSVLPTTEYIVKKEAGKCWKFGFLKNRGKLLPVLNGAGTLKLLLSDPLIENAAISLLEPNISIPPHKGYFKGYLRYHLCIETPNLPENEQPYIIVDSQKYVWKTGKGIMFDDMYLHQVVNKSNHRRIVLFLDIRRQNLPFLFNIINDVICKLIDSNVLYEMLQKNQHIPSKNIVS